MNFFDTHAHYNDEAYKDNLEEVLENVKKTGVKYIVNASYDVTSSDESLTLSERFNYFYATIGIHPHNIEGANVNDIYDIYQSNKTSKIVAVGEIGLDYAFVKDNKFAQSNLFNEQIDLANQIKLPIVIHSRDASLDTYTTILNNKPLYGALFHCFQPSDDLVRLVLDNGYYVAFGGNITYKRNESFKEYIKKIPIDKILIETDCPYLSPVPHRGTINTSANLPIICKKLSEYKEMDIEYVSQKVFQNSLDFFKIHS